MTPDSLTLSAEWDKTFPLSEAVVHEKIQFSTGYGTVLAADLYAPKGATSPLPTLAVSGPFGAVKEQASGLYAQTMAERGFLALAFDPSFTGESSGTPRYTASPDINTEDFLSAVDYLTTRPTGSESSASAGGAASPSTRRPPTLGSERPSPRRCTT